MSTFDPNSTYTLTARVLNSKTDTNWVGIGWTTQTTNTNAWNVAGTGTYWFLWRGNDQFAAFAGATNPITGSGTAAGEGNFLDLRIVLDMPANTATFLYKNPSASVWSTFGGPITLNASPLSGIKSVGFTTLSSSTGIQSFELTASGGPETPVAPKLLTIDNESDPNGKLIFTYRRRMEARDDGRTTIVVQYGNTLAGWSPAAHQGNGPGQITISSMPDPEDAGFELVTVALPPSLTDTNSMFVRLSVAVSGNPPSAHSAHLRLKPGSAAFCFPGSSFQRSRQSSSHIGPLHRI